MARISELHYSNAWANSTGVDEFLEVALSPGEDPADFTVGFYEANGTQGIAIPLTHPDVVVTFDPETNETTYVISAADFPILLTDPNGTGPNNYEAYALVDTSPGGAGVIDFYDIGGGTQTITATNGVAQGATSTNLPTPTAPGDATYSLQFNQPNPDALVYETLGPGDTGLICFLAGTRIDTAQGPRPVEALAVGDVVWTLDDGFQPLGWVGRRRVPATGRFAPIRIAAGVFENDVPLYVSPQHRILIRGWKADLLFAQPEVLVAACHLVNGDTITRAPCAEADYCHVMFDRHQIIRSNGALSESFYPGPQALSAVDRAARAELFELFPDLSVNPAEFGGLARPSLKSYEARCLEI